SSNGRPITLKSSGVIAFNPIQTLYGVSVSGVASTVSASAVRSRVGRRLASWPLRGASQGWARIGPLGNNVLSG
ncbi:MAG TPA: hypothetical protein VKC60_16165, partial [Opitutaceae bacterium]|nr:hypothetical protein [Opitutaceae bacterium]